MSSSFVPEPSPTQEPISIAQPRKLSRAEREVVRLKFGGRCAYCGRDLPERWHADHIDPVVRYPASGFYGTPLTMLHPERDTIDNFNPACPPCNIDKHAMTPDRWRGWLATRREALKKTPGWRLLESFGLVADTAAPVVFHYERALTDGSASDRVTDDAEQSTGRLDTP